MHDERDGGLTPKEIEMLAALPREAAPPPESEETLVHALRARGHIRSAFGWRRRAAVAAIVVAALALGFAGGTRFNVDRRAGDAPSGAAGGGGSAAGGPTGAGATFALLIFDAPGAVDDARQAASVAEGSSWAAGLAAVGILQAGEKLEDGGRRIGLSAGTVEVVGDAVGGDDGLVLGGFFLIRAASQEDAQRIASTCPLLRYGSIIEIRAVDDI